MSVVKETDYYLQSVKWISQKLARFSHLDKTILFGLCGGITALAGSLLGQILNPFDNSFLYTGVWTGYIGCGIGVAVAIVQNWYMQRLEVASRIIGRAAMISALGGFLGGVALILVKVILGAMGSISISHLFGWTVEGLIIAWFVAKAIPNLPFRKALYGGGGAGLLGGLLTLVILSGHLGTAIGDSFKGILIGVAIALAEKVSRESWIVVHRDLSQEPQSSGIVMMGAPPKILLGERTLQLGSSSDCEIFVSARDNHPPIIASIGLQDDRIVFKNHIDHSQELLDDGGKITIANLTIETFAKKSRSGQT